MTPAEPEHNGKDGRDMLYETIAFPDNAPLQCSIVEVEEYPFHMHDDVLEIDPDLAEKMKDEVEGILLWAFEGLQRVAANNFKFTESDRTRENRETVKRDNNNVYDFLDSDGYVRLKADLSASSKELYEAYQIYCTENNLPALKPRSFSEALIACQSRYNLEYCNNVTNAAGRRVRGFLGIEVLVRNHISVFSGDSMRTYVPEDVPEEWRR